MKLMDSIDHFLWKDFQTHLRFDAKESHLISQKSLKFIRIFFFIIHSWIPLRHIITLTLFSSLKYLTIWGMYFTYFYFILVLIQTFYNFESEALKTRLKKWTIIIFEIAFSFQFTITFLFWFVLYDGVRNEIGATWYSFLIFGVYMHFVCWASLWIDLIFNYLHFDRKHFWVLLPVMGAYLIINLACKLIYNIDVYHVIKWDSIQCYCYILIAIIMTFLHFIIGLKFSDFKGNNFIRRKTH